MKMLIITLFVFVTNLVSSPVLADDKNKEELKNAILKFKNKNSADLTISTLESMILEIKNEAFVNSIDLTTEIQAKGLKETNCKKSNGTGSCSQAEITTAKTACDIYPRLCEIMGKVDFYEPNYGMYSFSKHNDNALEVQYSGRYNFITKRCTMDNEYECKDGAPIQYDLFFSLTGRYDFYAFNNKDSINRDSRPVINRFFNPALHARIIRPINPMIEFLDYSIEHLSNGQSGDFKEINFASGEGENYAASDSNSISMFFHSISAQMVFDGQDNVMYKVFARAVLGYWDTELDIYSEDSVTIGEDDFPGYHRFKIGTILEKTFNDDKMLFELSFTGHNKTSFDAFLSYPVKRIPGVRILRGAFDNLLVRYHNGYLSRLSNYDLKEETLGIGFGVAF